MQMTTSVDSSRQLTEPEEVGFDQARLERLAERVEADIASEFYDGAQIAVGRAGHLVFNRAFGYSDRAAGRALRVDDVTIPFSIAKQLTGALVLSFVERGLLSLTLPVADVIPEFGARGKGSVTLFHLLTHTGGVQGNLPNLPFEEFISLEAYCAAVYASPLEATPGTQVIYSKASAHAVMASMLEAVDPKKRSFGQIVAEEVLEPLGMTETKLGPPPEGTYVAPVVSRYRRDGSFTEEEMVGASQVVLAPGSVFPGGGFTTTAQDFYKFADLLRGGGTRSGYRLLSPAMIELASRNYTGEMPNSLMDYSQAMRGWLPWPAYHGLGFFVRGENLTPGPIPNLASEGTFGGWGSGTSCFWVDPGHDVVFSLITTGILEDTDHLPRTQRLGDIVLAALVDV